MIIETVSKEQVIFDGFDDVEVGKVFKFGGKIYLKLNNKKKKGIDNAYDFSDDNTCKFYGGVKEFRGYVVLNAKLVITKN